MTEDTPPTHPDPQPSSNGIAGTMGAPDEYDAYEPGHPGYEEMHRKVVEETIRHAWEHQGRGLEDVVEIGPGTGILAEKLSNNLRSNGVVFGKVHSVQAVELDGTLAEFLGRRIEQNDLQNVIVHTGDALQFLEKYKEESGPSAPIAVIETFTDHHFQPLAKKQKLQEIAKLLQKGSAYIVGDEFLAPHDEHDPAQRVKALIDYHGTVIRRAVAKGRPQLALLELGALRSGLHTVGSFIEQTVILAPSFDKNPYGRVDDQPVNHAGIQSLEQLIRDIEAIDRDPPKPAEVTREDSLLPVEERRIMSPKEAAELRGKLLQELQGLQYGGPDKEGKQVAGLAYSPRPGLPYDKNMEKYGDYKMTVRQYVKCLEEVGIKALGYFHGPKMNGDHQPLNQLQFLDGKQDRTGGVWTIKAIAQDIDKQARAIKVNGVAASVLIE